MGLLDIFSGGQSSGQPGLLERVLSNPNDRALLSAAAAAFEASGPSLRQVSTGQVLGRMINSGIGGYDSALAEQARREEALQMAAYRKAQTDGLVSKSKRAEKIDGLIFDRLLGPNAGVQPQMPQGANDQTGGTVDNAQVAPAPSNTFAPPAPIPAPRPIEGVRPISAPLPLGSAEQQGPAAPIRQGGQLFPFSINDIAALKLGGYDLSDIYKLATDPVKMDGGSTYRDRATGVERYIPKLPEGMVQGADGAVHVLPGFESSTKAIKSSEAYANEEAKASFDPFYGVDDSGNKVLIGSRASVMGRGLPRGPQQRPPGTLPVVERSPATTQYETDMAKDYAARYKEIQNSALKAPGHIGKLEKLGKLLNDYEGGKFSGMALGLAQAANSMGIKIDPKLGDKEAAVALSNEMALSKRDPSNGGGMPGAMSDADRQFLVSLTPNLAQSAKGRKLIIDAEIAVQRRNMEVQKMAAKYQRKYGRVDDGFYTQLQAWAERNPLFRQEGQ